ncbi:hypothetical protein D3C72_1459600 [compost metagenome]
MLRRAADFQNVDAIGVFRDMCQPSQAAGMVNAVGYASDIDGSARTQTVIEAEFQKLAFQPALMPLEKIIHLPVMQAHRDRQLQRPAARFDAQGDARGPRIFPDRDRHLPARHRDGALARRNLLWRR